MTTANTSRATTEKSNILVTGGTGTLGRLLVTQLRQSGYRARILSRHPRGHVDAVEGDLATGAGIAKAVAGMDAIVHAASATREPLRGNAVDVRGTRALLEAAHAAGVKHIVLVSIVGIDRVASYPYYKTKLKTEGVVRQGPVPWSILRATQFHPFVEVMLKSFCTVPGVALVPFKFQVQPVDAGEVARRLAAVATGEPAGMLPDFGGPEVKDLKSLAQSWLRARRSRRKLVNLPLPFKFSRQMAAGGLLCPDHNDGVITFDQYLAARYG